jgi:hypothetical protein
MGRNVNKGTNKVQQILSTYLCINHFEVPVFSKREYVIKVLLSYNYFTNTVQ